MMKKLRFICTYLFVFALMACSGLFTNRETRWFVTMETFLATQTAAAVYMNSDVLSRIDKLELARQSRNGTRLVQMTEKYRSSPDKEEVHTYMISDSTIQLRQINFRMAKILAGVRK